MKHTLFKKAVRDIEKMSMTAAEKQAMLAQITKVVETRQAFAENGKRSVKSPWTVYSFSSWIRVHKLASVVAAILIIAISGNSIVLAANESLPGDTLYPIKVNVTEPIRVALVSDPVRKAEVQTALVQTRFEEAETLASRGELTDTREQEISDLIDRHVADVAKNVVKVEKTSPEKAEDANIAVQASMKAHARLLNKISTDRFDSSVKKNSSSDTRRIADKATKEADKFDRQFDKQLAVESKVESKEIVPAPTISAARFSAASLSVEVATTTDEKSGLSHDSASSTIEIKKRNKEMEIYTKAKEKLDKEQRVQELRKSDTRVDMNSRKTNERENSGKNRRSSRKSD